MGDTTISTKDTTIYYPSDWLIDGGPPFESMGCPKPHEATTDDDYDQLTVVYNAKTEYFGVVSGGFIVMETKEPKDLARYMQDYVYEFQYFVRTNADMPKHEG